MASDSIFSRRSFLAASAGVAAAAIDARSLLAEAQPAPATAPADPNQKKLGVAIMGIGSLAKGQILPAFARARHARPVAFITGHPKENRALGESLGINPKNIYTYDNYDSIKDNPEIDVVYNVLPNSMHAEYTIRGARAGKHILCEKPMANSVAECEAMIDACKAAGKKLMIAYRMQYEPMTKAAIALVRDVDKFGTIKEITGEAGFAMGAQNRPENCWRINKKMAGGGPLMDMGIYACRRYAICRGRSPAW